MNSEYVPVSEVITLKEGKVLRLGSVYQSDVFYRYKNLILPNHLVFHLKNGELLYEILDENEKAVKEGVLRYGEDVWVEGLCLLFLGRFLALYALRGDLRVNQKRRRQAVGQSGISK